MENVRVRIAPSPTGDGAHIGLARTTLFNWLFARHHGGAFILRSEDTDAARSKPEYEAAIQRDFEWLGLNWDEFHRQSERADRHREVVQQLLASGAAYEAYETPEELEAQQARAKADGRNPVYEGASRLVAERLAQGGEGAAAAQRQLDAWQAEGRRPALRFKIQDYVWDTEAGQWASLPKPAHREKLETDGALVVHDLIKGDASYRLIDPRHSNQGALIGDLVIVRADGTPTYNFAVVVDDIDMDITHVIRGDEHLNNTPKQMLIYAALGAPMPRFAHLPMILGKDKKKLSKRRSQMDVFISSYRERGFLPEALINGLARLGWSHGDLEYFSVSELVDLFTLDGVNPSAAVFDDAKLLSLNKHYLKTGDRGRLAGLLRQQLVQDGVLSDAEAEALSPGALERAVKLLCERATTLAELADAGRYLFREDFDYDQPGVEKLIQPQTVTLLDAYAKRLDQVADFSLAGTEAQTQEFLDLHGKKLKDLAQPTRLALTGRTQGAGLFETLTFFDQQSAVRRLERAVGVWQAQIK